MLKPKNLTKNKKPPIVSSIDLNTKERIKNLIEKRLTVKTIGLFASEYESLELKQRIEIAEFIGLLMEKEMNAFLYDSEERIRTSDGLTNNAYASKRRLEDFRERQSNLQKMQDVLIKKEITKFSQRKFFEENVRQKELELLQNGPIIQLISPLKNYTVEKKPKKISKEELNKIKDRIIKEKTVHLENKADYTAGDYAEIAHMQVLASLGDYESKQLVNHVNRTIDANSKIGLMLKEAEQREKAELKNKKKKDSLPVIKDKKSLDKKSSKKSKTEKKEVLTSVEKSQSLKERALYEKEKKLSAEEKKRLDELQRIRDKEYDAEQREKEKLREKLFGKKTNKSEEQLNNSVKEVAVGNKNKKPLINSKIETSSFRIGSSLLNTDEVLNPKNRLYVFWVSMRKKYRFNDILYFVDNIDLKTQNSILKKRQKFIAKLPKKSASK